MGGVVDGGVGIGIKTSPRRAAIEKAQAELIQEYDVREARKRELEFLEKGGNPLDFKFGNLTLSLQSTSLNDRHLDQFPSSEAKGSFALAASPLGDSFESSGRPGAPSVPGRSSADNPVHFAGENEMHEVGKNTTQSGRKNNISSSEQSSQLGGNRNGKGTEDLTIFRPYARRNRFCSNRDGGRLSSVDALHNRGGVGSSVAARASLRDGKGSSSEANNQKDQNAHTNSKPKILSRNGDMVSRTSTPENCLDGKIGVEQDLVSATSLKRGCMPGDKFEATTKGSKDNQHKQSFGNRKSSMDAARTAEDIVRGEEGVVSGGADDLPSISRERDDDVNGELNGSSDVKGDVKNMTVKIQNASEAIDRKVLESATCLGIGLDVENNAARDDAANVSSCGITVEQLSELERNQKLVGSETVKEQNVTKIVERNIIYRKENDPAHLNQVGDGAAAEVEEEANASCSLEVKGDPACIVDEVEQKQQKENDAGDTIKDGRQILHNHPNLNKETSCRPAVDVSSSDAPTTSLSGMKSASLPDHQSLCDNLNSVDKAYEDSVLEEAQIIEAKHKRIAELSFRSLAVESRQRCHWDFVLEELTWLANDFAQERLWKTTAAAQLCHRIASVSRLRLEEQSRQWKLKSVAHSLSQAVMQFWRSTEALLNSDDTHSGLKDNQLESMGSQRNSDVEVSEENTGDYNMDSCKKILLQSPSESTRFPIQGYALRFLRDSKSHVYPLQAETPKTPDTVSHMDIMEISWDDDLTEESLFYMVPSGAMEIYRKFIESYVTECERTGSNVKEEVGTSVFITVADQIYQEIAYDEDEAETSTLYLPGAFEGRNSSKFAMRKRKNRTGLYDQAADLPYGQYAIGTHPSMEKKRANLNVGPNPPKRMRTASRQRVLSPFGPGANAGLPGQPKNDTSSGDTNSFHDDQYILYGGSRAQRSMEVESAAEFEQDLPYEFTETYTKPKKKKKKKEKDSTFERGWHLGSTALCEQREHSKKRLEHFESNGTSGLYGQRNAKKSKMMKQFLDNGYDNIVAMTGSIPGPVASQMSNMSNQNKVMKFIGGRDRSRKVKAPKTSSLHSGPGNSWSLFEDQALVVLVHDMGPHWELVSDAINSTLQFKCIFRIPKECKERHKLLMDKTAGDGADSAEDSGTSQSYPSTLPGIPKGSARQLFQRLQSPVEEDALKDHFDKIIQIVQRQHHRRIQLKNESQEPIAVHNSHFIALSQVCANKLSGVFLTPLDLIEATPSNPDALPLNHQGSHAGMRMSIQGTVSSMPTTASNSLLPGSSGAVAGTNMVSPPSGPFNAPVRDGRYTVPKTSPSPGDEQQRLQYNPPLSNRKIPQSNLPMFGTLSGGDRGVHMLPGGTGLGMASGMSRTLPVSRPDFQGIGPSTMLNSSSMMGTPNPANSILRPREPSHMVRGGQNAEQPRQMTARERQMHVKHGNVQVVPPFNGLGSAFPNQTSSPGQTYPGLPQQQHQMSPQPANAPNSPQLTRTNHPPGYLKLAKERNLQQQRSLQQQQFAAPSNLMPPHVQPQPQIPVSTPLQNIAPIQPHPLLPLTPSSPMDPTQNQQKKQLPPHGLARNTTSSVGGLTNQIGKQRQRQPHQQQFQQPRRNHPQQRQQPKPQQHQGKLMKGVNRGSMLVHQKLPVDSSHLKSVQSSKPQSSQNSQMQQPLPSGPANPSVKHHPQSQPPSLTENSTQGQFPPVTSGIAALAPHQAVLMASNQQQRQQNQVAQQTQQMLPQNRQLPTKSTSEKVQGDQKFIPPTTPVDSSNEVTAVASAISMQNKAPEAVHDHGLLSTSGQGASMECQTLPSSVRTEALPSVSQGLGQRHISDTSAHGGHNGEGLGSWRQQLQHPPHTKQSPAPLPSSQQLEQQSLQQQQPPSLQTQQQMTAQGNTYVGSENS